MSDRNRLRTIDLASLQCRAQWPRTYPAGRRCSMLADAP